VSGGHDDRGAEGASIEASEAPSGVGYGEGCPQWRREGACAPGGTAGAAFGGAKIWNYEIWSFLANWRSHCRTDSAGSLHYVITPPT